MDRPLTYLRGDYECTPDNRLLRRSWPPAEADQAPAEILRADRRELDALPSRRPSSRAGPGLAACGAHAGDAGRAAGRWARRIALNGPGCAYELAAAS